MPNGKGTIVLMGSGELTATMVEIHKERLRRLGQSPTAVFVDTPAGFQLNVDHISQKAVEYFKMRVQQSLQLASFKSAQIDSDLAREQTYALLRKADYILIGPGSPTYALEQWQQSPIPKIMIDCVDAGGCLVAASAAALTVGRFTLPVYEIYKVGTPVHWVDGLDLLKHFGLNLVVVPHWNNAEGGNHDTRYCFMGAPRLEQLEALLPPTVQILGLDEHTALVVELGASYATIEGVGRVTFRLQGREKVFQKGDRVPLALLRGELNAGQMEPDKNTPEAAPRPGMQPETDVWTTIHTLADTVRVALELGRDEQVAGGLLELERHIWKSQKQLEELNEMGAAREVMREAIALLAAQLSSRPTSVRACVAPLVEILLDLRERLRREKAWDMADAVRDCLLKANIQVEDTPTGASWQLTEA
ncbi:MAG: Type 1 glutamine amidotransferase-like domain-containing protein [Desulfobacteraceae bacterium]|jgi:peptidase E